jgi:hypothetical protein
MAPHDLILHQISSQSAPRNKLKATQLNYTSATMTGRATGKSIAEALGYDT